MKAQHSLRIQRSLLWLLFLVSASCAERGSKATLESFRWLHGNWESERKNGTMVESWKAVNDSTMHGVSIMRMPDGSTQPFEDIDLVFRHDQLEYQVRTAGDNAAPVVSFRLTSFTDTGFVAENQAHDFPKRIIYRLVRKDSLIATIDAGPAHAEEKVDFVFSRGKSTP
jgi:hypothetical protein